MTNVAFSSRAVGFCYEQQCGDFLKGVFLLNYGLNFYCPTCRAAGEIVPECRMDNPAENGLYTQVEVEFDYNPQERVYKSRAIVKMRDAANHGAYKLSSPLIKTENRALKIAEQLLCALNAGLPKDNLSQEKLYTFDCSLDDFKGQMEDLQEYVKAQDRRLEHARHG